MRRPRELPDMEFMRREIPIFDVATALDIRTAGRSAAHCWRVGQHQNGDRSPSISFFRNRAKCHVCDARGFSTIDLVMAYHRCTLADAVAWITARFEVPVVAREAKVRRPERWQAGRVGVSQFPLESLVRAGVWAWLGDGARAILVALACFTDPVTHEATISTRGLGRYSGKMSRSTITTVIRQLENIGLLKVNRAKDGAICKVSTYTLTLDSDKFQRLLGEVHERLVMDRDLEKIAVAEARSIPRSNTLSNHRTTPPSERSTSKTAHSYRESEVQVSGPARRPLTCTSPLSRHEDAEVRASA
jgi:hypothetical protein